jgi:CRISPR-associated protein Csh1
LVDSQLSDYDSEKNISDYFYRSSPAMSVSPFPTLYISEEGVKNNDAYTVDSKDYKKIVRILKNNMQLNPELRGLLDFFSEQSQLVFEELDKYLNNTKKSPYILTISIDDMYIGRSPLFAKIRDNAAVEFYKDFYSLGDKKIVGSNLICSMCRENREELWGYVSIYNFYTSKTDFAPIAGGLKKEMAYRNYPVCPECAAKLKKLRPVVNKYFSFKFCGFDYLLIPEVIKDTPDNDIMALIIDIMVAQYDTAPGLALNLQTRLGEFTMGARDKIIDSYSNEIFDYLAETNNASSYTMLFYSINNAEFKILLTIENVFPCQFRAIFDAKRKAESHDIFKSLPGNAKGEIYDLEFRFDTLKEFLPIANKIEGDFSKAFLETTRNIFMQKKISFSFILQRIMSIVRRRFTNELNYELAMRKAFLLLKFMSYLGIISTNKSENKREVTMTGKFADFFAEHRDFFDSSAKQSIFMTGVLTQLLLNIQLFDKGSAPFRKRLNGLKLNKDLVHRIFTEAREKLEQYGKNYYQEMEQDIADLMVKGEMEKLSKDEISFFFTLGMTLYKKFKDSNIKEQDN